MDKKQITENWIKHKVKQMAKKVPYSTVCSCNPANGGSGMCGCVIGNQMVDPDLYRKSNWETTIKPFTEWLTPESPTFNPEDWKTRDEDPDTHLEEFNEYLRLLADMKTVGLKRKKKLLSDFMKNI